MNPAVWVRARHGRLRPDDPALADGERVHATWAAFASDRTAWRAGRAALRATTSACRRATGSPS